MSFDPFAPVPKDGKAQEKNVYDDILGTGAPIEKPKNFEPAAPKPVIAPVPQYKKEDDVTQPLASVASVEEVNQASSIPQEDAVEQTRRARRNADRQRSTQERGTLPVIREVVKTEKEPKKFSFFIAAIVATALIIGGGAGIGIFYALTNKSGVETIESLALNDNTLSILPGGFTAQEILDAPRVEDVTPVIDKKAAELSKKLDFIGTFEAFDSQLIPMSGTDADQAPVYAVQSKTYQFNGDVSIEQKQQIIDLANTYLAEQGYTLFDNTDPSIENPLEQPQIFVGGAKTAEDGSLESYNITATSANTDDAIGQPGVTITFTSIPHIKTGEEDLFKNFIIDYYNSTK